MSEKKLSWEEAVRLGKVQRVSPERTRELREDFENNQKPKTSQRAIYLSSRRLKEVRHPPGGYKRNGRGNQIWEDNLSSSQRLGIGSYHPLVSFRIARKPQWQQEYCAYTRGYS
ncbi:hypothetical protein A7K93_04820 [Candidatus Methylacidiphilum fumarolicum]|nr:hypothetical protein A7K73_07050 [Candidatus Methylacidiphilum fumarolicum]TFE74022.1 hypothetical protein A7K93_04820 [Candidatus Methylacidiphilum fumarolicum]TFE74130.1 hypothetical protein A7D33_01970 [Candidatus Methylacidiphilum fumarolicum]TFE74952.1 hypothetical protein A7K72_02980 [Candidatus Methylacidiphilum fumarolicum]